MRTGILYLCAMKRKPIVFFILKIWPEPDSSAAGTRIMQLIDMMANEYQIHLGSTASISEFTQPELDRNTTMHQIKLNDPEFNDLLSEIQPDVVVFDRYMTEEQFSWRVAETCPDALRILDTEDIHFLRFAREEAFKKGDSDVMPYLHNEQTYRELASIWRSDLSLIISEAEIDLLSNVCSVPRSLMYYLPLFISEGLKGDNPPFEERRHLMMIGNGHHRPNNDAVHFVYHEIWPELRMNLPDAELHIYGAYLPKSITKLHDPGGRFFIKGRAENVHITLGGYRILLAPLRFGAGIKGKLLDAVQSGTPSVTTTIGAEGIASPKDWPGYCGIEASELIEAASKLYTDKESWIGAQLRTENIRPRFERSAHEEAYLSCINERSKEVQHIRDANFTSRMIWHQSLRSTEFMSRWIEEKNKRKE